MRRDGKGKFTKKETRKDFFMKHEGGHSFPSVAESFDKSENRLNDFRKYEKKLPMIEKAFRNCRKHKCGGGDLFIDPSGLIYSKYTTFEQLRTEFYKEMKKQADFAAIANAEII